MIKTYFRVSGLSSSIGTVVLPCPFSRTLVTFDDQYLLWVIWPPGTSRPLEQNRASRLALPLLPCFSHVGGELRRVPQSEGLEGVAQKFRIFAAVVSKPAVPKRIGAH